MAEKQPHLFLDCDGVLADFDAGARELLGMTPREFEQRFGVPIIEVFGMTETGRTNVNAAEPRHITTRAFGKPRERAPSGIAEIPTQGAVVEILRAHRAALQP